VYFVRRYASDATTRGSGFFNDLVFRLGAADGDNFYRYEKIRERASEFDGDDESVLDNLMRTRQLLLQPHLSIPDIEYAMRFMPINMRSSVYLNAAPTVISTVARTEGGRSSRKRSRASGVATFSQRRRSQGARSAAASARASTRVPAAMPTNSKRPG